MLPLDKDLQKPKENLESFAAIASRVLHYLPNVLSAYFEKGGYRIYASEIAGTTKYLRPVNRRLFIDNGTSFSERYRELLVIFKKIQQKQAIKKQECFVIDSTLYTIQQSIGAGLDLVSNPNSARKHVGNRFEELIRAVFTHLGIVNEHKVLKIPYETGEGVKTYNCENDLILSPYQEVRSSSKSLDPNEIVVSVKTTSKDRMGKMFIDKMLLERFVQHKQKVIGIFLNDVQRKENNNISYTLVSGLFMVYSKFLTRLDGIYYLDPPPNALKAPYKDYMKPFSHLITQDLDKLLP